VIDEPSVHVGGDNRGIISTGAGSTNIQIVLGSLLAVAEVPPAPGAVGVPSVGLFVGRVAELARLHAALTGESGTDVVVQAVHGLGGVGKSSLVLRYVHEHGHCFTQVVWITADNPANLTAGLAGFAVALEPQLAGALTTEGLCERAVGWLCAHQGWLVVLDNVTDPADVRALIARATSGRFVITSRRAGGWQGMAQPLQLDVLDPPTARELVARVLGSEASRLLAGVEDLCEQLGYLPLALEQAAAYMAQSRVSAADYLRLLAEHPTTMLAEAAEGADAERTLARTWGLTLDRLADEPLCGDVLRILAWLAPDHTPVRLLAGLGSEPSMLRAIGRLAAHSMVSYDGRMIDVHRVVQTVARTPDRLDPHRGDVLITRARDTAIGLLRAALPDDPFAPETWSSWRELVPHVAVFASRAAPDTDIPDTSRVLDIVARYLMEQGAFPLAIDYLQRALADEERALGMTHADTLTTRHDLAYAYANVGDTARAIPLYEAAARGRRRVLGRNHPDTLRSRGMLAGAHLAAGHLGRAIRQFNSALVDTERVLGTDHADTIRLRQNLALAYGEGGFKARAIPLLERALADSERVLGADHADTLVLRHNLGYAYHTAGDSARAIPLLERTLADSEPVLGPENPEVLRLRCNLGDAYRVAGDGARAIPLLERALADSERVLGADSLQTVASRNNLALACHGNGDAARAVPLLERSLDGCERILGPAHPLTKRARHNLAVIRREADATRRDAQ
jgi:tetratricopeptide (TPR) repeat protein